MNHGPDHEAPGGSGSVAGVLGKTVNYYEGAAAINQFFTDLVAGTVNPAMLWIAGTDAQNNIDSAEGAALTANATRIANFVASGGGLMAHGSGPDAYGWLAVLIPGIIETPTCSTPATLTAAGMTAFPGLTNADISAGPCHSSFSGNLGSLQVLAARFGGPQLHPGRRRRNRDRRRTDYSGADPVGVDVGAVRDSPGVHGDLPLPQAFISPALRRPIPSPAPAGLFVFPELDSPA